MPKITKKELEKLWFEEYVTWQFVIRWDMGNIEYHQASGKVFIEELESKCLWIKHLEKVVEVYHWLVNLLLYWETMISIDWKETKL